MSLHRRPTSQYTKSYSTTPSWRTTLRSKKSAVTCVSLIFAQPEYGAPLPPASSSVNISLPSPMPSHMILSTEKERDHTSSVSSFGPQSQMEDSVGQESISVGNAERELVSSTAQMSAEGAVGNQGPVATTPQQPSTIPEGTMAPAGFNTHDTSNTTDASPISVPLSSTSKTALSTVTPKSSPGRSSWFGSLPRSKGKARDAVMANQAQNDSGHLKDKRLEVTDPTVAQAQMEAVQSSVQVQHQSQIQQTPTIPQSQSQLQPQHQQKESETPPSEFQLTPPRNDRQQPKRGWFSSTPDITTPSTKSLGPPSPLNYPSNQTSTQSSIQVELPAPITSSPQPVVQSSDRGKDHATSSLLNPSTSRFTLSMPLFGKAKISSSKATGQGVQDNASTPEAGQNDHVTAPSLTHSTSMATTVSTTATTTAEQISPQPQESQGSSSHTNNRGPQETGSTRISSWWNYLGWSAAGTITGPPTGSENTSDTSKQILSPSAHADKPAQSSSDANDAPIAGPSNYSLSRNSNLADINADVVETKERNTIDSSNEAPSACSVKTSHSQSASWYSPWTWYSSTTSSSLSSTQKEGARSSGSPTNTKAQSELVRDEALVNTTADAQSTTDAVPQTTTTATAFSSGAESNPIQSTITTNRSGWATFFSSRALIAKTITDQETTAKYNGMEIMDLDDENSVADKGNDSERIGVSSGAASEPYRGKEQGVQVVAYRGRPSSKKPTDISVSPLSDKKPETAPGQITVPPVMISDSIKGEVVKPIQPNNKRKSASPTPSKRSGNSTPVPRTPLPNLVLPTWQDTFYTLPRNRVPQPPTSALMRTINFVSGGFLFANNYDRDGVGKGKEKSRERQFLHFGNELPRAWDIVGDKQNPGLSDGFNVVVMGIHGWFPGAVVRTVLGEPTGTSSKFVNMMVQALDEFQTTHDVKLKKVTSIPLSGEGTIDRRVEKLYASILSNQDWLDDLHAADAILVATHSQGCIVATHLLDRLICDKHIRTARNTTAVGAIDAFNAADTDSMPMRKTQKICCLSLCGIHLGPLRYLSSSTLFQPYIQYFESTAARELFEFQNTESQASKAYVKALRNVMGNGTKMVYVASLNDQVVPIYSGIFACASHPLILRALYIDGDAYHSSDFLSKLLVLLLRVLNSGLSDSGLLAHLSEATAGSLSGVGHSTAYEELATYSLAVKYLFLTNDGVAEHPELVLESFNATHELNDYEIPWALRDLIADERVVHFFSREIIELRDAFREWLPKTTILRDIKRKLQPIQRLPHSITSGSTSNSKL